MSKHSDTLMTPWLHAAICQKYLKQDMFTCISNSSENNERNYSQQYAMGY